MRKITDIVIHCSATPKGRNYNVNDIRKWHVKGNGWSDIGYHYVILLDGTIQRGRPLKTQGAHVRGHNKYSIGICYIGGGVPGNWQDTRTTQQKRSLLELIKKLKKAFTSAVVRGHRDFRGVKKMCPCFDCTEYNYL